MAAPAGHPGGRYNSRVFGWMIQQAHRRGLVPRLSSTEREALEAGTVWADGELFSGRPDLETLLSTPYPELSEAERAFLDGPVETICRRVDPWELARRGDLAPEDWDFLRAEGFFGLALPTTWGGLGFSALGQSAVFGKLASRSLALSAIVLIPNSVGPGELLLDYGTEEQKARYLPPLARGDEIPCFALTEPAAGSDAASLSARGVLFRDAASGELRLRLDWDKRYITLAPVATLIGLAFRLFDPDNLLERPAEASADLGITCALVPANTPGVEIGRRHDPMGIPLPNGPIVGRGVEIPATAIIGGLEQAGKGWRMLMEALAAGRSISLPAQSAAGAKKVARVVGAYAAVRHQFGLPIARFGGIEEPLARIAGLTYALEAARITTCGALAAGHRPAVLSAAIKVQSTELCRRIVLDGMDVMAGAALCRGPRNPLSDALAASAIGITVEGANILTRSLIVFGQGALRAHPHLRALLAALESRNPKGLRRALWRQSRAFVGHGLRAAWFLLSGGGWSGPRGITDGDLRRYGRRLRWASTRFALLADLALLAYGPALKREEKISGRFADALSWMYLLLATLRRFAAEDCPDHDRDVLRWTADSALSEVQSAFEGIARNFEGFGIGLWVRTIGRFTLRLRPLGRPPGDRLGQAVARGLIEARDHWTAGLFQDQRLTQLDQALEDELAARPIRARLAKARLADGRPARRDLVAARAAGLLSSAEAALLAAADDSRQRVIAVDSFLFEELFASVSTPSPVSTGV